MEASFDVQVALKTVNDEDGNRVKFVEMLQICNDIGASCVMVQINAEIESD